MILQNALVYTPRHTFERGTIVIRDGRIVPFAAPEEGEEVLDAEGLYALPGLVDIHFHGAMGKDFCDGTEEAIQTLADFEASKGVLAICPATMTYPEEILNKVMDAAAAHKNGKGADLVGINMEGPFISPKKVGAQNPEYVLGADAATASLLAVIPLTILTRVFAITQKTPVTVFLLTGIFPLVPGAGIYYTAYYFIQNENTLALAKGISTFKIAVALAIGISLVLCVPLPKKRK